MSRREVKRARLRKLAIGDMRTPVVVHSTRITAPSAGVDFGRNIQPAISDYYCKVTTLRGVTIFDSSNVEQVVTHEFAGRYDERITENMFIEHEGQYYRVVTVEDYEDRHEYSVLLCTLRGPLTDKVNEA